MFTAALLTTSKVWKQAKYSSVDEWIKKIEYICMNISHKKKEILPFAIK